MKITSIDIIDVANDFSSATSKWRPTVVRVNTDEGISGFGEVGLAYGVGVEKVFPIHSPLIEKVETVRSGYVRRAKLYYLRGRVGKAAKIREKL